MEVQLDLLEWKSPIPPARFDGKTYEPKHDHKRMRGQLELVFNLMQDGRWRSLEEIAVGIYGDDDPFWLLRTAGLSARLRDLRKDKFGGHTVDRQSRGDRKRGLFEYRLLLRAQNE